MKNILFLIICAVSFSLGFISCSNEDISPSYADQNLFEPSSEDHSANAELQRNFYKETGSYLLFNDTLKKVQNGTDAYGNPIWKTELVDVEYPVIGDIPSYTYTYSYIKDLKRQTKVASLVKEKLATRLGKGVPYSMLLVDSITMWTNNNGVLEIVPDYPSYGMIPHPTQVLGTRCYVISTSGDDGFTDSEYFTKIFSQIVFNKLQRLNASKLAKFYSYGERYYQIGKTEFGYGYGVNDSIARSLGFWKDYNYYYLAMKSDDLEQFCDAACTYTLAEVKEMMADFPLVIERFQIICDVIKAMGIKLDD